MLKSKRKAIIAGNWKMNGTRESAKALIEGLKQSAAKTPGGVEVIVCVPFTLIDSALEAAKGSKIKVAAQNVHWAESGAFTAEISAAQLKDAGVDYAVIGHSERRQFFGETDETVGKRVTAALSGGITPILCVGEYLSEREDGITSEVLSRQIKLAYKGITEEQARGIIVAYEPVWAIGTGVTATAEQADETCGEIREILAGLYGENLAESTVIQYGGSMNAKNAAELLGKTNVDGGLVGGASLKASDFSSIIDAATDLY